MTRYARWFKKDSPEDIFFTPELETYYLKLKTGEIVQAKRVDGYWFGLWKWIPDNEVEMWTYWM